MENKIEITETQKKEYEIRMAVSLIQNLFQKGMIKKTTYEAVRKDSQKMIDKHMKLC